MAHYNRRVSRIKTKLVAISIETILLILNVIVFTQQSLKNLLEEN